MAIRYNVQHELAPLMVGALQSDKGWSLQGLGMFRFYLSKEWRLHVWDDRFRNPEGTRLHDHPWDFDSYILSGSITNHVYMMTDKAGLKWNTDIFGQSAWSHHEQTIVCGPGGCAKGETRDCALKLTSSNKYLSGEAYSQLASQIHDTEYERGTITLVHRTFKEDTEHAHVYADWGKPWVSNEPRPATRDELGVAMSTALLRLIGEVLP